MELNFGFHLICFGLLMIAGSESRHIFQGIPEEYASLEYISHKTNENGEVQLRLSYKGILVIETLTPELGEFGLFIRHSSDAKHVVKAIYNGRDNLVDCDIERSREDRQDFTKNYFKSFDLDEPDLVQYIHAQHASPPEPYQAENHTLTLIQSHEDIPKEYTYLVQFDKHKQDCRRLHKKALQEQEEKFDAHGKPLLSRGELRKLVGFVGEGEKLAIPQENQDIYSKALQVSKTEPDIDMDDIINTDNIDDLDAILRSKNEERKKRHQHDEEGAEEGHGRNKRSTLIYPGTNWCGKGNRAAHYDDLGIHNDTDACCREHDNCPFYVEGFSSSYGIFNYRMHTLSRCRCDELFRQCLKNVGDHVSEMMGSIYFNYMGTMCFQLRKEKTCMKRSWWGHCIKHHAELKGEVKDALVF